MKLIIAGSRDYEADTEIIVKALAIAKVPPYDEIVSGRATGIDWAAELFANSTGVKAHVFDADWDFYGNLAGYKRNKQMAEYVAGNGALLAIVHDKSKPSSGTKDMIDNAKTYEIPVYMVDDNDLRSYND